MPAINRDTSSYDPRLHRAHNGTLARGETILIRGGDTSALRHFGADFHPLNLEHIAVACNSGFPLPARL